MLLWLAASGAGVCIALGLGHGVASADAESSDGAESSRSARQDSSQAAGDTSVRDSGGDSGGDSDTADSDTAGQADTSSDPATVPRSVKTTAVQQERDPSADTAADELSAAAEEAAEESIDQAVAEATEDGDETATLEPESKTPSLQQDSTEGPEPVVEQASTTAVDATVDDTSAASMRTESVTAASPDAQPETESGAAGTPPAPAASSAPEAAAPALAAAASADTVTGVQTGRAKLTIPVGPREFTTRADWYFPTQADGSVSATGIIWLQHGFLGRNTFYSALAKTLSQQTNSVVVAPNLPSFPALLRCGGCWINGTGTQQAVATMFLGDRASLTTSAQAAGYQGALPEEFVLSGHSAGGGFATAVGGYYAADPAGDGSLSGVVMFDGFSFAGVVPDALQRLDDPYIPVYQIAAPPQLWNFFGATTSELVAARPGRFVGATLAGGSHVDSLIGGSPIFDFAAQLVTGFSPPGNTAAVYTLATGWINDLYQGLGPTDGNGIYGAPDEYIVMGDTAAVVLAPAPVVDIDSYLGTWYEVGSVKQFFSIGLVNTTAVYSLDTDGSIKVENSGNYFFDNGPESSIVGVALPVDATDNKLNVTFFGPASDHPPGNYWVVDLDPDYQWAIVSDPTGLSGFLLSRTRTVSADFYQELLDRASVKGVRGWITRTRQPAAEAAVSV